MPALAIARVPMERISAAPAAQPAPSRAAPPCQFGVDQCTPARAPGWLLSANQSFARVGGSPYYSLGRTSVRASLETSMHTRFWFFRAAARALLLLAALEASAQPVDEVERVKAANRAYYEALSARDIGAMEQVWSHTAAATNVAPPVRLAAHVGGTQCARIIKTFGTPWLSSRFRCRSQRFLSKAQSRGFMGLRTQAAERRMVRVAVVPILERASS